MAFKPLTRLSYWQGQELRSRDLRDQSNSLEQLRWWHNRAEHGVFGVSQRLSLDWSVAGVVTVDCGLAYDCFGRELLLSASRAIPVPANGGPQYLVLEYSGASTALAWVALNDFRASSGVPLALIRSVGGSLTQDATFSAPRARALTRPRLAAGSTVPGNTPWEKLPGDAGLTVVVDTSSAGFTKTPFYLTSLNWLVENTDFSTPIVTMSKTSASGFTLRLLLNTTSRERLAVVSGVGLVDKIDASNNVSLRKETGFGEGQNFQDKDVLARLLPQANLALPIANVTGKALTLGVTSSDWSQKKDDPVVLGRLPAIDQVKSTAQAIVVSVPVATFPVGFLIVRMAGTLAGSAAVVKEHTTDGRLILQTALTGLAKGDAVGTVKEAGTVTLSDATGKRITLVPPTDLSGKLVLRKSSTMETEQPTTVTNRQGDGTLDLKDNIGLANGDTLYVASPAGTVDPIGASLTLVGSAAGFQIGDLVGVGPTPAVNHGIVAEIDGQQLLFDTPLPAAPSDAVVNADFPARSTVSGSFFQFILVRDPSQFQPGDVVALLSGTRASKPSQLLPSVFPGFLQSAVALSLASGDVLGKARFNRAGKVNTVGTPPTSVQLESAAVASFFKPGDTVANLSSTGPFTLSVVDHVTGDTVFLRVAIPHLVTGNTLGIVALNAVAIVTDPIPDSKHFSVDAPAAAVTGGVVAPLSGWLDASPPVAVQTPGAGLRFDSLPDGLMTGDALGFAALSPTQPKIRFDALVTVSQASVQVQGPDELSGQGLELTALVGPLTNQQASLTFPGAANFMLRPENAQITESSQVDDFLAYAQRNGLYVCWLGCQMAPQDTPSCPGITAAPCACG